MEKFKALILSERDIKNIIAEKFKCESKDIYIGKEPRFSLLFGQYKETIAEIKIGEEIEYDENNNWDIEKVMDRKEKE